MPPSESPAASVEMEDEEDPEEEEEYEEVEVEEEEDPEEEEEYEEVEVEEEEEDDEEEYEEVEVEEEVEEEEEEEEEEKLEVSEPPAKESEGHLDLSRCMDSVGQERNLMLVSSVAVNTGTVPAENNDSYMVLTMEKEDLQLEHVTRSSSSSRNNVGTAEEDKHQELDVANESNGSLFQCKTLEACNKSSYDSEALLSAAKESGTVKSSSDAEKDAAIDIQQRGSSVEDAHVGTSNSINKIKQLDVHSGDEMKQMTSRFTSPDMRIQSQSPSAEMKDTNKRPAIICSFFAKGWCIRGGSCRFLHVKDNVNNSGQQAEGDLVYTSRMKESQSEEGLRGNAETSGMTDAPVPLAASPSLHPSEVSVKEISQDEQEASLSKHPSQDKQKSPLSKEDSSNNQVLPIGRDSASRDGLTPENRYIFNASNNYFSRNLSSYPSYVEGLAPIRNKYLAPRSSFMGSEWKELPLTGSSGIRLNATGYKRKISYDWEPSVPFQPSFFITSAGVSSTGDMYDPFQPCVEVTNLGDGSLKASIFIDGPPIPTSSRLQTYDDCAVAGEKVADINEDKSSVSSHHRFFENEENRSCVPLEKDGRVHDMETTARINLNSHNGKASIGENNVAVEDNTKTEVEQNENNSRYQGEGSEPKKRRIDKTLKNSENNFDFQIDSNMRNDSKALKIFRTVLVDLVKELLRPSWQEGHLSKDAHNSIVKKSVDKVISTLQPHQIPTTIDAVNNYVSSSRLKIGKLVDGYVKKYRKS